MMRLFYLAFSFLLIFSFTADADTRNPGLMLDQTRLIFNSAHKSESITLRNASDHVWLIRSWVASYSDGNTKSDAFIITPPIFRLDAQSDLQLRVNGVGNQALPTDRESVYRINVLAIPPKSGAVSSETDANTGNIQFSINTQIKLFYRPVALDNNNKILSAQKNLVFSQTTEGVTVRNNSPYYVTLYGVTVAGIKIPFDNIDSMVHPFGQLSLKTKKTSRGKNVSYTVVNDFGGMDTFSAVIN
ncbi:molecular chaperone [Hafnia paralvei]|jgi:fimbrial chaperone protein|uniref:fimbrial biogenesis chaperone n=1 Tax=Hafnia paralvei TaxID=546367 RepID=UPI001034E2B3|nr:molecular chaperone [Hafnia paralvei]MDX6840844.1 molecular chaperone [Hafnia paralvei]TBM01118.1 molecular chaperone [Hafnia paralvei]TBM21897.1 molecular chaperone [Hafnia paralvei]